MNKQSNRRLLLLSSILILSCLSCKTSFDEINYSDGNADFTRIVAIGSGYLAGYSDQALYREAQANSIPALMAGRLTLVGGGYFVQPMVNVGDGIGLNGNMRRGLITLDASCNGQTYFALTPPGAGDVSNYNWLGNSVAFNNVSVPGTRMADLTDQSYGDPSPFLGNPLYARFASNPGTSTMAGDALLAVPSFFIVWLGMDDIYDYAISGGEEGRDSITDVAEFSSQFTSLLNSLTAQNASGIVANIPLPSGFPFFTTIGYNDLVLTAAEADELNVLYATVDPSIQFVAGNNRFVIADSSVATGRRQIEEGELILLSLSTDSLICYGLGRTVPIPAKFVLDADEVFEITNAVGAYNTAIQNYCTTNNIAMADMRNFFNTLSTGYVFNGVTYTTEYLSGGAFSVDGFYPSGRGAALMANQFLRVINSFYSAKIPLVDVNKYPGIAFP